MARIQIVLIIGWYQNATYKIKFCHVNRVHASSMEQINFFSTFPYNSLVLSLMYYMVQGYSLTYLPFPNQLEGWHSTLCR